MQDGGEEGELPLAAAWEDVKQTRITGLAALEDAQSALAALDALVGVGGGGGDGKRVTGSGGDHRRHPAVLRLLSQCPFPQLASYVASGEASNSSSSSKTKASSGVEDGNSFYCFPPAGGRSARGTAAADRRLSEAALVLCSGAEAAERAARAAGDLASLPEDEFEALLVEEAEGGGGGHGAGGGGDEAESESPAAVADADAAAASRLRGLSLASAAPVSLAAVADALELLAKMRRAVASGEEGEEKKEKKEEDEEEERGSGTTAPSSSSSSTPPSSQPLPPAACPWSSLDHLHSYALFWELAPFVDERDVEVALAVERAAWRKRRRKKKKEEESEQRTK